MITRHDVIAAALVAALALIVVLGLCGCGSRSYLEAVADARAGAQAAGKTSDAGNRARLFEAVGRRLLALSDGIPALPAPAATPDQIAANPEAYLAEVPPSPAYQAPPAPEPSPWQRFRTLGDGMVTWGGIIFACGSVISAVAWLAGWLGWAGWVWSFLGSPVIAPLARLAASLGGGSAVIGAGLVWAVTYWWALLIAGFLAAAIVLIWHRDDLARAWHRLSGRRA